MSTDPFTLLPQGATTRKICPQGHAIFRQGKPTAGLYRVYSGAVVMQRTTADGDSVLVHKATAGQVFAEASLFTSRYHCDAVCAEASEIDVARKSSVLDALQTDPAFSLAFCALLAQSVHQSRQTIEILALTSAEERVLAAVQLGMMTGTIAELAQRIGLTQATCYRALSALTRSGKLHKHGRGLYVLAP